MKTAVTEFELHRVTAVAAVAHLSPANDRLSQGSLVATRAAICLMTTLQVWSALDLSAGVLPTERPSALATLLNLPAEGVTKVDIARMNLLCAEGLPGTREMDVSRCLTQLDTWANRVRHETARHAYRFKRNPAEFEHSEGFFRMLMLAVVLAEDFRIQYDPKRRGDPTTASANDGFFADSRAVFIHGLLGSERKGTCSSLPVLHAAIGRRLGYPLKLVTTKGHLFVRWEGNGERFNVEATGEGLNKFEDGYYRTWPDTVTDEEVAAEGYLKSLSPPEELAVFLSIRGLCLREAGRINEAAESFSAAARLAPNCRGHRVLEQRCRAQQSSASAGTVGTK